MKDEKKAVEIMKQCKRFDKCSAPECPLDINSELRTKRLDGEKNVVVAKRG